MQTKTRQNAGLCRGLKSKGQQQQQQQHWSSLAALFLEAVDMEAPGSCLPSPWLIWPGSGCRRGRLPGSCCRCCWPARPRGRGPLPLGSRPAGLVVVAAGPNFQPAIPSRRQRPRLPVLQRAAKTPRGSGLPIPSGRPSDLLRLHFRCSLAVMAGAPSVVAPRRRHLSTPEMSNLICFMFVYGSVTASANP